MLFSLHNECAFVVGPRFRVGTCSSSSRSPSFSFSLLWLSAHLLPRVVAARVLNLLPPLLSLARRPLLLTDTTPSQEGKMLARQGLRSVSRTWAAAARPTLMRSFGAEPEGKVAEAVVPDKFKEDWSKIAPNYDLPHFPSSYMKARPPVSDTLPTKLIVNFVLPHTFELNAKEVDMVILPAKSGQMGVLPGHVPTIAELKPGVLSVHEGSEVKQYFLSSGFAFVHANSVTDIVAIEAVPLDKFDPDEVRKGVQEYTQKVASAKDDLEKAEAQIGLEVHSALQAALGVTL